MHTTEQLVMARLAAHGWTADRILTTTASIDFDTAVGPKQATARITADREYPQFWLRGEYISEGSNALATCFACIPANAASADVDTMVDKFMHDATCAIGDTYAVRLLSRGAA